MLVIFFKDTGTALPPVEWHIGEGRPNIPTDLIVNRVSHIQADGDELLHIERRYRNIPHCTEASVVTWFGDDAKFIVKNLK